MLAAVFCSWCLGFFFSWVTCTVCSISMWNRRGQHSTWCGRATGILWPSPRSRRGSTSSRATWGLGGDRVQVTAGEAGGGTQGGLLFKTDIYISQNYHSEGKWNLVNVVWDTKERHESSKDVQKNKLLSGSERLSHFLSYRATTGGRPERLPVSQGKALPPLCLQEGVDSVMSKCWLCTSHQLPVRATCTQSHPVSWMLDDYFPCV